MLFWSHLYVLKRTCATSWVYKNQSSWNKSGNCTTNFSTTMSDVQEQIHYYHKTLCPTWPCILSKLIIIYTSQNNFFKLHALYHTMPYKQHKLITIEYNQYATNLVRYTQQNSYPNSFSRHSDYTVTGQWQYSQIGSCQQHGDYTAIGSSVTVLPAFVNSNYTVTVQSLCSHCA